EFEANAAVRIATSCRPSSSFSQCQTAALVLAARRARALTVGPSPTEGERSAESCTGVASTRSACRVKRATRAACVEDALNAPLARQARRLRGALRPSAKGRTPLGAPPWRFWAGMRFGFRNFLRNCLQRAPRGQVVVPDGRFPSPPGSRLRSRDRGTPRLAPPSVRLRKTPLDERGWRFLYAIFES